MTEKKECPFCVGLTDTTGRQESTNFRRISTNAYTSQTPTVAALIWDYVDGFWKLYIAGVIYAGSDARYDPRGNYDAGAGVSVMIGECVEGL